MESIENLIEEYLLKTQGIVNYNLHTLFISTFHSTSIEGSTLTENQVIDLLEFGKTATNKPFQDHLMVKDHYQAMVLLMNLAEKKIKLTENIIQQIGANVMQNTGGLVNTALGSYDISKGDYRKGGVFEGSRQFPDAKKVPDLIKNMLKNFNEDLLKVNSVEEKLRLSFKIHFEFVSIHPFVDGNGRASRLLMNYVQFYFKLPICAVFRSSRLKYIISLEKTRKMDDLEVFYKFMFSEYSKFLKNEMKNIL